jgi:uncharacterized protein (TIGR02001 family)
MFRKILITFIFFTISGPFLIVGHRAHAQGTTSSKTSPTAAQTKSSKAGAESDDDEDDEDEDNSPTQNADKKALSKSNQSSDDETTKEDDDDEEKGKAIAGNVSLATDYTYRGITQTNNQPALQGGFDWKHPTGFSLGVWGSNIYFPGTPSSLELDSYCAFTYNIKKDWNVSLGVAYLSYFQPDNRNTVVIPVRTQWRDYSLEVDYSPNFKGEGNGWYFLLGWSKKLIWETTFGANVGYSLFSDTSQVPNYVDTRFTVAHDFLDLEWMVTGIVVKHQDIGNSEAVSRLILSVTKAF